MIVIMVALPQLNCDRATFTTVDTISSTINVFVYDVVITTCILYIIVLTLVTFSFCFSNFVNSHVFCCESSIQFLVHMCLLIYIHVPSTFKFKKKRVQCEQSSVTLYCLDILNNSTGLVFFV